MTPDDLQAALDAATATLASGGIPRASLHARDVLALVRNPRADSIRRARVHLASLADALRAVQTPGTSAEFTERNLLLRTVQRGLRDDAPTLISDLLEEVVALTAERDALARWKRWTECWAQLHPSSLDFEADSADERAVRREAMREYGDMLRYARTEERRTMGDVADALGCTVVVLSGVERSREPPFDEATTRKLCAFLGCDPGPLLDAAAKCEEAIR